MVTSISSHAFSSSMQTLQANNQQSITQDQRKIIEDTLAQYDSQSLTQADASSIVEMFKESGIQPGRALADAMTEFGFDAKSVGDLAGVGGPPPGGPEMGANAGPAALNISDSMLQELNELLSEYYSDDLSEESRDATLSAIKEIFQEGVPEGGLVNVYA
ncbi:MAG: hypothetical protein RBR45_08680 [Pseudomonas sp.]|jgi:hypothetical protein|nr:hypothetical protein [Pseudomonas sp.]